MSRNSVTAIGVVVGAVATLVPAGAVRAEPEVGNGACNQADFCQFKSDTNNEPTRPVADWSGDVPIDHYAAYWYYNTTDSPNDDVEWLWNRDGQAQRLYEDPNQDDPSDCFSKGYNSSDLKGRENNATSHEPLARGIC